MLKPSASTMTTTLGTRLAEQLANCGQFPARIPVQKISSDPLAWLRSQPFEVKFCWSDRTTSRVIAGAGVAASVEAEPNASHRSVVEQCRGLLRGHKDLRCFGGLSFDGQDGWEHFGAGRFVVPRFVLEDEQLFLTVMDREDVAAAKRDLNACNADFDTPAWNALPNPSSTKTVPTQDGWLSTIDEALTLIRSEVLEKIVLARKTTLVFNDPVEPWHVAAKLKDTTYDCYVFCFQFAANQAFLGATPERLFRRDGRQLRSEVIAGTRPRGTTTGEDQRLAYDLLTSEKDQLEHDIVRKSIRQKLHKLVEHLSVDSHASVLRLANKQHLCSAVQGELKPDIADGALLERLHPTPAVGGYPTENALPEIARLEPFDRGWYAAPIGWIGADSAEFVVGIRSGRIQNDELSLYSGAGIVQGSDPHQEWAEVDNKIRDFLDIFGG